MHIVINLEVICKFNVIQKWHFEYSFPIPLSGLDICKTPRFKCQMHLKPECLVHTVSVMLIWMVQTIPEELRRRDQPHLWSWLSVSFLHSSEGTLRVSQTNQRFDPENMIKNKYTRSKCCL